MFGLIGASVLALALQVATPTARGLYEACTPQSTQDGFQDACLFYFAGYRDGWELYDALAANPGASSENEGVRAWRCAPENVTVQQVIRVFRRWVEENPESEHVYPTLAIMVAVGETWPCPVEGTE